MSSKVKLSGFKPLTISQSKRLKYNSSDFRSLKNYLSKPSGKSAMEREEFFTKNKDVLFDDSSNWNYVDESKWKFKQEYEPLHKIERDTSGSLLQNIPINKDDPNFGYDMMPETNLNEFMSKVRDENTAAIRVMESQNRPVYLSKFQQELILTPNNKIRSMMDSNNNPDIMEVQDRDDPNRKWKNNKNIRPRDKKSVVNFNGRDVEWQRILGGANERSGLRVHISSEGKMEDITARHFSIRKESVDPEFYGLGTVGQNTSDDQNLLNPIHRAKATKKFKDIKSSDFTSSDVHRLLYEVFESPSAVSTSVESLRFGLNLGENRVIPAKKSELGRILSGKSIHWTQNSLSKLGSAVTSLYGHNDPSKSFDLPSNFDINTLPIYSDKVSPIGELIESDPTIGIRDLLKFPNNLLIHTSMLGSGGQSRKELHQMYIDNDVGNPFNTSAITKKTVNKIPPSGSSPKNFLVKTPLPKKSKSSIDIINSLRNRKII